MQKKQLLGRRNYNSKKKKRELDQQNVQLEQAKFEQVKEQMQQQQQQILIQQQMQADYQKQQLRMQEQLLQQQTRSQNITPALFGKLYNKEQYQGSHQVQITQTN